MVIDLGNTPIGDPPTPEQAQQIKNVLGIYNTDISGLSGNWESTYNTVNNLSSYWDDNIAGDAVTVYNSPAGSTITCLPNVTETIYLSSGSISPLSSLSVVLPNVTNSYVGQVKLFVSSKNITSLNMSVNGGGSLLGNGLTSAFANEVYSYQCISITGNGTWLRLA